MARASSNSVRDRLLQAGVETFRKSGFNGCSVQDITEAAGVPKGSFYNHFESKEALGAAALEYYWDGGTCDGLQILRDRERRPLDRLRAYFAQVSAEMAAANYLCGCFIGNMAAELSDHSPVISAELATIFRAWSDLVAACIREARQAGEITTDAPPEALATFILNAWEGALLRSRIEKGESPLHQFTEIVFTELLR